MPPVSSPSPDGHDGEQSPLPGGAARDAGPSPDSGDGDFDGDAGLARLLDDIGSGRVPVPSEDELRALALMSVLGTTADVDPVVLAAMGGPDGLGGQAFAQERVADAMAPGPLLAALTE
ncbi:MAG TPA: hypothetical protein VNV62_11885, partial [Trebonia sp.]|nr:hypothetical protein [Trebonia sp.]